MTDDINEQDVNQLLSRAYTDHQPVLDRMQTRRLLVNRILGSDNATGTLLPPPFDKTTLALKSMIGQPSKAVQHYASRISANRPDIQVIPLSKGTDLSETADRLAGDQERLDAMLWEESGAHSGGRGEQWKMGWAMAIGGVGYYLTLPRDATFGLPDRIHYSLDSDDAIQALIRDGKISPVSTEAEDGKLIYAEDADVWAGRRKTAAKMRAVSGTSLFTLRAFARDQVLVFRDQDGIKAAAILQEITAQEFTAGSSLARSAAKRDLIPDFMQDKYGLIYKDGRIIGGITEGAPIGSDSAGTKFVLVEFFTRVHHYVMVAGQGSFTGGKIVYSGKHGATRLGNPTCPVVEVPFTRTDVNSPGMEFSSPMEQVFALAPLINQLLTLGSNASAYNMLPRWVIELTNGEILRDDTGEPILISVETTPGLDPKQAAAYPGSLRQLTIKVDDSLKLLDTYLSLMEEAMPAQAAEGASGSSEAAWHAHQMIAQHQANLRQPVDNHASAVREIVQMWHGWLRQLDTPIYFLAAPTARSNGRQVRGLVEFDPAKLSDSIVVSQELDTQEESIVRIQIGMQLVQAGAIQDEEFYAEYMKKPDARQAVIDKYVQQGVNHIMGGIPAPPGSLIATIADAVRGQLTYQLLQQSPNFAIASAEQMLQQAGADGQAYNPQPMGGPGTADGGPHGPHPNVADVAGVQMPGMGMAETLSQQLGPRAPGAVPV